MELSQIIPVSRNSRNIQNLAEEDLHLHLHPHPHPHPYAASLGFADDEIQIELPVIVTENTNYDDLHGRGGSTHNSGMLPLTVTGAGGSNTTIEENHNFSITVEFRGEGKGKGEEGEAEAEAEAETGEEKEAGVEGEAEAEGEGDSNDDPSNPRIDGQRLANSKLAPYALSIVVALLGSVIIVLKQGKHTLPIAKAYMLVLVVSSGIAYAAYSIYSWIIDRSNYKMLKGIYYICCTLAFVSLLGMLYTSTT